MKKVITYGTYDLLHYGHIRLLERAKALGDYLIVGVTADDFDKTRGKINVQQSLMERVEAVRATGIADEIIIEEYEGQKIDDIRKNDIDIFTVGSDWKGKFDYLKEYCEVVYLDRTIGISSSDIREKNRTIKLGLIGDSRFLNKIIAESKFVNGVCIDCIYNTKKSLSGLEDGSFFFTDNYEEFLERVDAIYVKSYPTLHYSQIKKAILFGKSVLCESPMTLNVKQAEELFNLAKDKKVILMEAIKTAYATAFSRLLLLIKSGMIGKVIAVDATCTSIKTEEKYLLTEWNGIYEWGPTALLPIFQILGTNYEKCNIVSHFSKHFENRDLFNKIDFIYKDAVASVKVGDGVKSEGELIISGTKGYIYVPAPWWKTDYFEVRFEEICNNKKFFYQLDGEGIRYELVAFVRAIENGKAMDYIAQDVTLGITNVMEKFENGEMTRI